MGSKCGPNFHRFLPSLVPPAIADGDRGEYLAPDRIFPDIIIDDFRLSAPPVARLVGRPLRSGKT